MKIIEVLNNIDYIKCYNKLDLEFNDVGINSNDEVDMFIGLKGENNDGSYSISYLIGKYETIHNYE